MALLGSFGGCQAELGLVYDDTGGVSNRPSMSHDRNSHSDPFSGAVLQCFNWPKKSTAQSASHVSRVIRDLFTAF